MTNQTLLAQLDQAIAGTKDVVLSRDEAAQFKALLELDEPAETSARVAKLASAYADFTVAELLAIAISDETGTLDRFCADIRTMAASLLRQVQP